MSFQPCRNCQDRTITCHGNCVKYKKFCDMMAEERLQRSREFMAQEISPNPLWRDSWKSRIDNPERPPRPRKRV